MLDIARAIQNTADEIKSLLNDIKLKEFNAAKTELAHAIIPFSNSNELSDEAKATIYEHLQKANNYVHLSMELFKTKEESVHRIWCAKVGVFFYLYRRFYLNKDEPTLEHCMVYVNQALNSYVIQMVDDIANKRDFAVKAYLFKDLMKMKQRVHDDMKILVQAIFYLLEPPADTCLPFWDAFLEEEFATYSSEYYWPYDCEKLTPI